MNQALSIDSPYLTLIKNYSYHKIMLIDMHIHTRFSPCSIIRVAQLVKKARETGLDGICITDHDTIASKSVLKNIAEHQSICIIIGMEYTTRKGDFLVFGPVDHIASGMDAEDLMKWSKKEGAILIPAHPFRKERPVDMDILKKSKIIEGLNGRNRPHENELCQIWLREHGNGIKITGGSDAHTLEEVGRIVTVFKNNIYNMEDLVKELRNNDFSPKLRHSF